jgi:hypothetical protein
MKREKVGRIWAACVTLGLLLGGCGDSNVFQSLSDDSSSAAKQERGLDALNNGDYAAAAAIYEELYADDPNPEVAKYLASAYVGQAGFDTLALVDEIAKAEEAAGSGDSESVIYDAVTNIFDADKDGTISEADLNGKAELLEKALNVLVPGYTPPGGLPRSAAAHAAEMTDRERFQAGLYAAIHAVLSVVSQLPAGGGFFYLNLQDVPPDVIANVTVPQGFEADLALVRDARDVILDGIGGDTADDDNDIAAEFDKFLTNIGYLPDLDVTDAELQGFLGSL